VRLAALSIALTLTAQELAGQSPDAIRSAMAASVEQQQSSVQRQQSSLAAPQSSPKDLMAPSLDLQKKSVQVQAQGSVEPNAGSESFLTLPWPALASAEMVLADCDPLPPRDVESLVAENAVRNGLRPELLREVMRRESAFRPCAVSRAGAQGLMQLMPATASQFRVTDPFDPQQNAAAGAKFLKFLLERYGGDVALALGAYNAGPARVDEAGGVPAIQETRQYVHSILGALVFE
jgi:soluble lytic murein transglycosylase-like protein